MSVPAADSALRPAGEQVLGYLNFSSGQSDPLFLANLNRLFAEQEAVRDPAANCAKPTWQKVWSWLESLLAECKATKATFRDAEQAERVLAIVRDSLLPKYLEFHQDLLFHQTEATLFRPYFLGRVCEVVLQQGGPWEETERITAGAITQLNDYIGHRPVPVLERRRMEPDPHEFHRPLPIYIAGAGVACGRHEAVTRLALEIIRSTDDDILRDAYLDPQQLHELALDVRAYDFDHPANKRPNYHFGQWDPHQIDQRGNYRRFVAQEVTFEALLERVENPRGLPADELLFEGAAVLAGTMLMAAGISGRGPETHDSTTTLATLLPRIAAYRDRFYERLIEKVPGKHGVRLRAEAQEKRQPFGGARQHLNAQLARRRAMQLEHVHLAKVFARMGYADEATEKANVVPVASARMLCRIDCLLTAGHRAIDSGEAPRAAELLREVLDLLHRAIACGAVVDPWNILGFDAHYGLFPAAENSIRDHRVDELIQLMEQIFGLYSRAWSEAAARDDQPLAARLATEFREVTDWWHKFAVHEVKSVDAVRADDAFQAAQHVADALRVWHKGGAKSGDIRFWAPHSRMFDSPKAYALVIEELLERGDLVASMGLLVQWLSEAERIGLEKGDSSFHKLVLRWLRAVRKDAAAGGAAGVEAWELVRRCLDYLEANADTYWHVPEFALSGGPPSKRSSALEETAGGGEGEEDEEQSVFDAAYENVVYRDSTDDGVEGQLFDTGGQTTDEELELESKRITERLEFLTTLARLWKGAALWPKARGSEPASQDKVRGRRAHAELDGPRSELYANCGRQALVNLRRLFELLATIGKHPLPKPSGDQDSLVEYDRHRVIKESLLERIIATSVEIADAGRLALAASGGPVAGTLRVPSARGGDPDWPTALDKDEQAATVAAYRGVLTGDVAGLRAKWPDLLNVLSAQPLLYVPLGKGGDPVKIVAARIRQRALQDLLAWLPRLGMLRETCQLLEAARHMERNHPVGPAAVTEFDSLFEIGFRSLVEALVQSASRWSAEAPDHTLVACLGQLKVLLLRSWVSHSSTLRLSVLEKVGDQKSWDRLVHFIEHYGNDLFTQRFMNPGNLRAILHQGVDAWITRLEEEPQGDTPFRFLDQLGGKLPRAEAVQQLTLALEAIVENYSEYRDYNSTTTQSDRGELLYMLLDFLRLRTDYDRVAWNLRPVVLAHEILVRRGAHEAAELWRRDIKREVREESARFLQRLVELQRKYAMRMPTVADRLAEGFVRPMTIDRIRALVELAMSEAKQSGERPCFEQLSEETNLLLETPSGVGLDVPPWLGALEEEVERVRQGGPPPGHVAMAGSDLDAVLPQKMLTLEEIVHQLADVTAGDSERKR